MSVDDYFTKNMYKGKIYKTNNMQGLTIAQYCSTDSAVVKEQKRIEREIAAFEKNMWGNTVKKDSLDSIAKIAKDLPKIKKRTNRRSGEVAEQKEVKKNRRTTTSTSHSSGSARVSVRRERHIVEQS